MGLDKFLTTKKSSKKKTKKKSSLPKGAKSEKLMPKIGEKEQIVVETKSMYRFITFQLTCTAKCGYKKTMKRSKSFKPNDKELICPKCGKTMKIKK